MQTNNDSLIGRTLRNKYQITSKLSSGERGNIYLAKDITDSINKQYIIKQFELIYESKSQLEKAKELLTQEGFIWQKLGSHYRIPQIFAYFAEDEQFFLVQELIDGQNLQQELDEKKHLTDTETVDILRDTLGILKFVHLNDYIHQAIKPSKLIRNKSDHKIYLINFGAVKEKIKPENIDSQDNFIQTINTDTPGYIPKEQKLGQPEFCSDIYALGMVAIQALTGVHPSELAYDRDGNPIWREHLPTSDHNPQLLDLIDGMVRGESQQRYQSETEVLEDLNNLTINQVQVSPKITAQPTNPTVDPTINPTIPTNIDNHSLEIEPAIKPANKKILFLEIILASATIIAGIVAIWIFLPRITQKYVAYENSDYGIQLERPENWSIQEEDSSKPGVIFLSPIENNVDDFQEKVTVAIENLPQPLSLQEYTEQVTKQIEDSNEIIEPPKDTTFANQEGREIIYQAKNGNQKQMAVWTLNQQKAYIATYTAEVDKFDKFLNQANKIIKSITIN